MGNTKTLSFLKTAKVAVIVSEDNKLLKDFINYISDCADTELSVLNILQYDCDNDANELRIEAANKIISINGKNTHNILPIEFLHRKRFVTALLRSLFFRIPENYKTDIQMFNLYYFDSQLRLECEFGENAGLYVVYDYDEKTGQFKEIE